MLFDHPAALCERLAAGELDVALVSSFEFLRAPIYTIVDGVSISANGPVFSVFLAYQGELNQVEIVEADASSLTSVNLLRCMLPEAEISGNLADKRGGTEHHGRLLIGDQAIRFRQEHEHTYRYLDLAEEWRARTGLPFVFALWLIRPEVADPESIAAELRACRDANLRRLNELADTQVDFPPEFVRSYWRENLSFQFGAREQAGLLKFRSLCESHRLIEANAAPLRLA